MHARSGTDLLAGPRQPALDTRNTKKRMHSVAERHNDLDNFTGYMHPNYAFSLKEFGQPRELPRCGGWVLERPIFDTPYNDAMGCYPLFACQDWSRLPADLNDIGDEFISVYMVTDPFGAYKRNFLNRCFKDIIVPFKQHFIVDLSQPISGFVSRHHIRNSRKALSRLRVEKCENPERVVEAWISFYDTLVERHHIKGIPTFSRAAFTKQFSVPGMVAFQAVLNERPVGMLLWYLQGEIAYYHLGACSSVGYDLRASFGLFYFALEYFKTTRLKWLNLGGGSGVKGAANDGLSRFKNGWATGTRTAYFCGRIFDPKRYAEILKTKGIAHADYFPAYRKGEFE